MTAALLYPLYPFVWCAGFVFGFLTYQPAPVELAYGVTVTRPAGGWVR